MTTRFCDRERNRGKEPAAAKIMNNITTGIQHAAGRVTNKPTGSAR